MNTLHSILYSNLSILYSTFSMQKATRFFRYLDATNKIVKQQQSRKTKSRLVYTLKYWVTISFSLDWGLRSVVLKCGIEALLLLSHLSLLVVHQHQKYQRKSFLECDTTNAILAYLMHFLLQQHQFS